MLALVIVLAMAAQQPVRDFASARQEELDGMSRGELLAELRAGRAGTGFGARELVALLEKGPHDPADDTILLPYLLQETDDGVFAAAFANLELSSDERTRARLERLTNHRKPGRAWVASAWTFRTKRDDTGLVRLKKRALDAGVASAERLEILQLLTADFGNDELAIDVHIGALSDRHVGVRYHAIMVLASMTSTTRAFKYADRPDTTENRAAIAEWRAWQSTGAVRFERGEEPDSGIGVVLKPDKRGCRVHVAFPLMPAESSGVQIDEVITAVDGTPIGERHCRDVARFEIAGERRTPVTVTSGSGAKERNVTMVRAPLRTRWGPMQIEVPGTGDFVVPPRDRVPT